MADNRDNLPARMKDLQATLMTKQNAHTIGAYWPMACPDKDKQGERILRLALLAISNPKADKLAAAAQQNPDAALHAIKEATELGLEIGGSRQQAALVPYAGTIQFQPMYRGLIELAMRSGTVLNIEAGLIYKGDWIEYSRGFPPKFEHIPWLFRRDEMRPKERGDEILCAYALFWLKDAPMVNGTSMPKIEVVEKWELDRIRDRAKNQSPDGPWKMWAEEMMKKTAIKRGCKTLRCSTELAEAIEKDNQIEGAIDTDFEVIPDKKPDALAPGRHTLPKRGQKPQAPDAETGQKMEATEKELHDRAARCKDAIENALLDSTDEQFGAKMTEACKAVGAGPEKWRDATDAQMVALAEKLKLNVE